MSTDTGQLAAKVRATIGRDNDSWVWRPLLELLTAGRPVTLDDLAHATNRTIDEVRPALAALPDTEYNRAGKIVGYGLTLIPTPHRFEVDDRQLFTWCAWDTLFFPILLGRRARVTSPCHATGTPVQVTVEPDRLTHIEPTTAVVSMVTPDQPASIRAAFCNQVHFFVTAQAAQEWLSHHPGATVLPVADAFALGHTIFGDATPRSD